jgi:lipopolysaccharide export system ATP-binding protein
MRVAITTGGPLAAQSLRKMRRGREVVKNASLYVYPGELVGLLGPRYSGKRTILRIIAGITAASSGNISVDGHDVGKVSARGRRHLGIAYVPGRPGLDGRWCLSNLFAASPFNGRTTVTTRIQGALTCSEPVLDRRAKNFEGSLQEFFLSHLRNTLVAALSGGERLRCELAHAYASRAKFMLLDEPFSSIDARAAEDIRYLVRRLVERGIGLLITDRNVRTLGLLDRAYIISDGQIVTSGAPRDDEELLLDPA